MEAGGAKFPAPPHDSKENQGLPWKPERHRSLPPPAKQHHNMLYNKATNKEAKKKRNRGSSFAPKKSNQSKEHSETITACLANICLEPPNY